MTYTVVQTEEFVEWLHGLADQNARRHVAARLVRAEAGNLGDTASVGDGVSEMRIHYGPGYRLYFTMRDRVLVIMLCGGDKGSQKRDIKRAKEIMAGL